MAGDKEVGRISIRVLPNLKGFYRELKTELEKIEATAKATVQVEPDLTGFRQKIAAATKGLPDAKVHVDVDRNQLTQAAAGMTAGLAKLSSSAASASEGFQGLGRNGLLVTGILAAAAPAVGLVSGLLAGLPSLAAAGGAGIGALALGMEGIKASAARLTPELDRLKTAVSSVFEQRMTPVFDQLRSVFPVLQAGMAQVANGMTDMFQGAVSALTSAGGLGQLQTILASTGQFFTALQGPMNTLTQSFLTLGSAGAQQFGLLSSTIGQFAGQFSEVVNRMTANGSFDAAMQGLATTLGSVGSLFNRLFESGVQAMGQLGGPLSSLIDGLGDAFVALMPALTSFSSLIGNVGGSLLSSLTPAINAVTPAFTQLANMASELISSNIASLTPVFTELASALGTGLKTALDALAPMLPGLLNTFSQLASVFAGQLSTVLPPLATAFGTLAGSLLKIAPSILQSLAEGFIQMAPSLQPIAEGFAKLATAITPMIPQLVQFGLEGMKLAPMLMGLAGPVLALSGNMLQFVTAIASAGAAIAEFAGKAVSEITALPGKITAAVGSFGSLLLGAGKSLIQGLINGIKSMVGVAIAAVKDVAGSVVSAAKGVLGIHSPSTVFAEIGRFTAQGFADGLADGQAGVVAAAKDMIGAVNSEFEGLGSPGDYISKTVDMATSFGRANLDQAMSDLGIGGGALTAALNQGLDFGTDLLSKLAGNAGPNITYNVSSADDAIALERSRQAKASLTYLRK